MLSFWLCLPLLVNILTIDCAKPSGKLIKINEDNWSQLLEGEWMVDFYAPWCPACKNLEPNWETFASWSEDLSIKVASVDVTTNPGLSGRFMITALPTIFHVKNGIFRQYKGSRDPNSFVAFVEEKKWESIEPISAWKSPGSVQMSAISYFFKVSMALRTIHNHLVEDYGIPYWGSYVLFAIATIFLGTVLGLLIVCVVDILCPSKHPHHGHETKPKDPVAEDLIIEPAGGEIPEKTEGLQRRKKDNDDKPEESHGEETKDPKKDS